MNDHRTGFLLAFGLSLCACNFEFEMHAGIGSGQKLPDPDIWRDEPPPLTQGQQARQAEVDAYVAELYKDHRIVATKQGYSGDIYDWIESSSMPSLELPALPLPPVDLALPEGVQLPLSELNEFPELLGPVGSTPMIRPDFSAYVMGETGAVSLQDYLDHDQVFGAPGWPDRLYAGLDLIEPSQGVSAIFNHYAGEVEDKTFSLVEMAVTCPAVGPPKELIGMIISVDRVNFDRNLKQGEVAKPRLHVEYAREIDGELRGVYDGRGKAFVPLRIDPSEWDVNIPFPRRTVLGGVAKVSEVNGMQYEHRMDLIRSPSGDWWMVYNGEVLGIYPADRFTMLNQGACNAHFYSEIYDGTPEAWTFTDMGSGLPLDAGPNRVAYMRRLTFREPLWVEVEVTETMGVRSQKEITACYTRTDLELGGPLTGNFFFYTGQGSDAPGCD